MALGPPPVDLAAPPADLDRLVDWFDAFCHRLVLLEEYSLEEIRIALRAVQGPVLRHCRSGPRPEAVGPRSLPGTRALLRLLDSDHERFCTSIEQLEWFTAIVARENHGGHRQALGQYGRAFAESFRRHRADELSLSPGGSDRAPDEVHRPAPAKGY